MTTDIKSGLNLSNAKREPQIAIMKKIIADGVCPFCRENIEKYHTKPILFETKSWIVTENAWPYENTQKHILLISQRHVRTADELNNDEWIEVKEIQKKIRTEFGLKSATILGRLGDPSFSGATVEHLHLHIISAKDSAIPVMARIG